VKARFFYLQKDLWSNEEKISRRCIAMSRKKKTALKLFRQDQPRQGMALYGMALWQEAFEPKEA